MMEVKDYSMDKDNTHYQAVPSMYGKIVSEQLNQQSKYCMPGGPENGAMKGATRNTQVGPKI